MSTTNPRWAYASNPLGLIPPSDGDPTGRGEHMVRLVGNFILTQGAIAGRRMGEVWIPFWRETVRRIFSDPAITTVGIKVGKGSAKTTAASAIALATVMDFAARGINTRSHVIIVSATIEAALICFQHIRESIAADPYLAGKFKSNLARREVVHISSGICVRVIAPNVSNAVGIRPCLLIADELHAAAIASREFGDVIDQLRKGGANQLEFRYIGLTTAATSRPEGYYREWLNRLRAIRDGEIDDPTTLPILAEFPSAAIRPELDPTDPAEWWRGMPALRTPDNPNGTMDAAALEAELREAATSADINGPSAMEALLSQRLGLEATDQGGGSRVTPLARYWPQCVDREMSGLRSARSADTFIALDPSGGLGDPFAAVLLQIVAGHYYVWSRQFLVRSALADATRSLRSIYNEAVAADELIVVDSTDELEREVFRFCNEWNRRTRVTFGGDARGLSGFTNRFKAAVATYTPVAQNWELQAALERASALAFDRYLHHGGQPLLTANVSNLVLEGSRLQKYDAAGHGMGVAKIDGAMALLSAIQLAETQTTIDIAGMIG